MLLTNPLTRLRGAVYKYLSLFNEGLIPACYRYSALDSAKKESAMLIDDPTKLTDLRKKKSKSVERVLISHVQCHSWTDERDGDRAVSLLFDLKKEEDLNERITLIRKIQVLLGDKPERIPLPQTTALESWGHPQCSSRRRCYWFFLFGARVSWVRCYGLPQGSIKH